MSKTITKEQRLQLIGLHALAMKHNAALADILEAAAEITGEAEYEVGHTSDLIYSNHRTPDQVLKLLGVEVENGEQP